MTGTLTSIPGVEIKTRHIVKVATIQAAGSSSEVAQAFSKLRIEQSGGIAGLMLSTMVTADGKVVSEERSGKMPRTARKLSNDAVEELHSLVSKTDWSKVRPSKDPSRISDSMKYEITIESQEGRLRAVMDSATMMKHPGVAKMLQLIHR